ncbi:MAG: HipA N-terminal domain-containing protein, partial [Propionibacteriaceae bacterium]|nr:HipA N-terminal domain-containing protein [Propionibacteriaceae bacterium]
MTQIWVDVDTGGGTVPVGVAYFQTGRALSTTFVYDPSWLARSDVYALDPVLPLVAGSSHVAGLPGCFQDAAPDRWGRDLIRRRLARSTASSAGSRTLTELNFLLGVSDVTRQGALRFRMSAVGAPVTAGTAVPPLLALPRLLRAADDVARGDPGDDEIKALLDAGTASLGGAHPKAAVRDGERLLLAKFSHPQAEVNETAWEMAC